jgi:hypothetical protein
MHERPGEPRHRLQSLGLKLSKNCRNTFWDRRMDRCSARTIEATLQSGGRFHRCRRHDQREVLHHSMLFHSSAAEWCNRWAGRLFEQIGFEEKFRRFEGLAAVADARASPAANAANFFRPRWMLTLTRAADWPVAREAPSMLNPCSFTRRITRAWAGFSCHCTPRTLASPWTEPRHVNRSQHRFRL